MNRRITGVVGVVAALGLAATMLPGDANAAPGAREPRLLKGALTGRTQVRTQPDNRPDRRQRKQSALRQKAVDALTSGEARTVGKGQRRAIRMTDGSLVDYPASRTAEQLSFLVDFGNGTGNPDFPTNTAGPVHNQIPQPGPADNTTYWEPDFSQQHYQDMFFNGLPDQNGESFHDVYDQMSSHRFNLQGDVSDWVTVPHPEAYYQTAVDEDDDPSTPDTGAETGTDMQHFIQDAATAWFDKQLETMTDDQVKQYLAQFDHWDRYDYDNDGNFDEPDGYIDYFQAIHAGQGEEAGAPTWTIWSHRSSVQPYAKVGPAGNPSGGIEIGDTGYWIRDYTTEPENGGLGVFAHEFGHDLGLPDYYDTVGGDNGTGFWNLMSSGSWMGHGNGTIGTTPVQMGATEKLFLGWYDLGDPSNLAVVNSTDPARTVTLGPSYHATDIGAQAVKVKLPNGTAKVPVVKPEQGTRYFYSGNGDDRDARLTSPAVAVPSVDPTLTARVNYSLEDDFDYTYVRVSTDDGATWTNLDTNLSTDDDPNAANQGSGITGCSGTRDDDDVCTTRWVSLSADLSAYAGQTVKLQFQTVNDGAYHEMGFALDEIALGGTTLTNVDDGATGWSLQRNSEAPAYVVVNGSTYTKSYEQYYLAENRTYRGYDATLSQGPYSADYPLSAPDVKVDHYPYQDGLLIWYWNGLYDDNNTSSHPGGGLALPVDANPRYTYWTLDGTPWYYADGRLETYDSTFDVDTTAALHLTSEDPDGTIHYDVPAHPSNSVFDDSNPNAYWDKSDPVTSLYSTRVAGSGTSIRVLSDDKATGRMTVRIAPVAPRPLTRPTITGTPRIGSRLAAAAGTWTLSPTLRYQWLANNVPIAGATGAAFTPRLAQLGKVLSVRITATKAAHPTGTATTAGVRVLPATVALSVKAPKTIKHGKKVRVMVSASAVGVVPTGRVRVRFDGRKTTKTVKGGRVTFRMPATHKGKRKLVVTYLPATGFTGATRTITIKIT